MSAGSTHWLPRADSADARGELLRRSFEDRLERRDELDDGAAQLAVERIERLHAVELERLAALAAIAELPDDLRALVAGVLALPPAVQDTLAALARY